jgi:4-amino-4-deoxy-L-arabinose transferase-like glycosyltransferase
MKSMYIQKTFLKRTLFHYWQIICVTALGAFLRFYRIGAQPLWLDEAYSFQFTQLPLSQLWGAEALREPNPPLYYTLLKLWVFFFGESETALRSLSAVIGTLTIPLLYVLGRTLGKQQLGIIAALLLAISPINIQYGQEARAYALLTMCVTLIILGLAGILNEPEETQMPIAQTFIQLLNPKDRGNSRNKAKITTCLAWLAYIVGSSIAFYAHSTAIFLLGISSACVSMHCVTTLRFNKIFFWNWIAANTLILVAWAWWLTFMLQQTHLNSWIPFTTIKDALMVLNNVLIEPLREPQRILKYCKYFLFICLASLGLWRLRNSLEKLILINTFLVGFPLLVFIISLYRPLFIPSVFLWTTIPFYMLLASGISAFRSKFIIIFAVVVLLTLQLRGIANYYHVQKEPWNEVASYVMARVRLGDRILFYENFISIPFNYYFQDHSNKTIQYGLVDSYSNKQPGLDSLAKLTIADIPYITSTAGRVWFVKGYLYSNKRKDFATSALSTLNQNMNYVDHLGSHVNIDTSLVDVLLFEKK